MTQRLPSKYAPGCAYLNSHSVLVTARNHSTSVFKKRGLLILFFYKKFYLEQIIYVYFGLCLDVF